jgi:hypothetical protein
LYLTEQVEQNQMYSGEQSNLIHSYHHSTFGLYDYRSTVLQATRSIVQLYTRSYV